MPSQRGRSESTVAWQGQCTDPLWQSNGRADTQRHSGPEQGPSRDVWRHCITSMCSGNAVCRYATAMLRCDKQRQSAALERNDGKEPIRSGLVRPRPAAAKRPRASHGSGYVAQRRARHRGGKPLRFLAMASQRLKGWAAARQRLVKNCKGEANLATRRQ